MKFRMLAIRRLFLSILVVVLVIAFSNLTARFLALWLKQKYAVIYKGGGFFWGLSNPELFDAWLLTYVFFVPFLFTLFSSKFKLGFFLSIPVPLFYLYVQTYDPHLWLSLIFLAASLGLAWVILFIKNRTKPA